MRDRPRHEPHEQRRDRGQSTVLLLAVITLAVVSVTATARFAGRVVTRQQAQTAADAAALAGAAAGRTAASELADANGAVLVTFVEVGDDVQVVVRVGGATATARATRAP
jgi:predicted transcriptional regulator